ncbi:MAG: hypothetical protein J1E61_08140 [Lachnospiraceae bacterium]|nr:hypothetical protein [Lachnospiraceae bacterium]
MSEAIKWMERKAANMLMRHTERSSKDVPAQRKSGQAARLKPLGYIGENLKGIQFGQGGISHKLGQVVQQKLDGIRANGRQNADAVTQLEGGKGYTLTTSTLNGHIIARHGPDSKEPGKSRFNKGVNIEKEIGDTITDKGSKQSPNTAGRPGTIYEKTYSTPIGVDCKGRAVSTLKVVVGKDGKVITAFPKK